MPKGDVRGQKLRARMRKRIHDQAARRSNPAPRFIGIDGEGLSVPSGEQQPYVLLAASTGDYIYDEKGLDTHDCLMFVYKLAHKYPDAIIVIFGGNYDFSQMLSDVPDDPALELAQTGRCWWQSHENAGWVLRVIPNKQYIGGIKRWRPSNLDRSMYTIPRFTVYDVWPFFQSSFVVALRNWGIGDEKELAIVERGKAARANFADEDRDEIIEYCVLETRLLVRMMDRLARSIEDVHALPMPEQWHGAGALASSVFDDRYAQDWLGVAPKEIFSSYYGGRIEAMQIGLIEAPLYEYDINSAYPYAMAQLPSMKSGDWNLCGANLPEHGACEVRWDVRGHVVGRHFGPFPVRYKGSLWWPATGRGWYLACEVAAAVDVYGDRVEIIQSVEYRHDGSRPMRWIEQMYSERLMLKEIDSREGTLRNVPLKLALNALYGKTAQRAMWRFEDGEVVLKQGRWRSDYIAAYATALTRSSLLRAAAVEPDAIIGFSTDSILSTRPLDLPIGSALGEWSHEVIGQRMIIVQPGFRMTADGSVKRVRGGLHTDLGYEDFLAAWEQDGIDAVVRSPQRRYVGLRTAAGFGHVEMRGYWTDGMRDIRFMPERKRIGAALERSVLLEPVEWPFGASGPVTSESLPPPSGADLMRRWGNEDSNISASVEDAL